MSPLVRSARLRALFVVALSAAVALPALPALAVTPSPSSTAGVTLGATPGPGTSTAKPTPSSATPVPTTTRAASPTPSITPSRTATTSRTATASRTATPTPSPSATGPRPPLVPGDQGQCRSLLFYGVRGAGVPATAENGLGTALTAYRQRFAAAYGDPGVGSYAADYSAPPVTDPRTGAAWQASEVTAAIAEGSATVAANLVDLATTCADSALVLAGEDLGALVVRAALVRLAASDASVVARLSSVVLVGDPGLHPTDPGVIVGGGYAWASGVLAADGVVNELPPDLDAVHVCHNDDIVCQGTGDLTRHAGYDADANDVIVQAATALQEDGVAPAFAVRARVAAPVRGEIGAPSTLSVVVSNAGTVANALPGELRVRLSGTSVHQSQPAVSGDGWTCTNGDTCARTVAAGALRAGAELPPITVVSVPASTAPLSLSAQLSDVQIGGVASSNLAWAGTAVASPPSARASARVTLQSRVGPTGGPRWLVTLTNAGGRTTTAPVRVDLTVTGAAAPLAASGAGWVCLTRTTCLYVPSLDPGGTTAALTVDTEATIPGPSSIAQTLQASVRQHDNGGRGVDVRSGLTVASTLRPRPGGLVVTLTPSVSDGVAPAGTRVVWTAVVRNTSADARPVGKVVVRTSVGSDTAGTSPSAIAGAGWVCSDGECAWTGAELTPGTATGPLTFQGEPADGEQRVAAASVTADDDPGVGLAETSQLVRLPIVPSGRAHLQPVVVASAKAPLLADEPSPTWRVAVVNTGRAAPVGRMRVVLGLPGATSEWRVSGGGWRCVSDTCTSTASPAPGASSPSLTITRTATTPWRGAADVTATVVEEGAAPAGNATASARVTVGSSASSDLAASISGFTAPVRAGAPVQATVRVRNVGRLPVDGASLRLESPVSGWSVTAKGAGWECSAYSAASCSSGTTLAPGEVSSPLGVQMTPTTGDSFFPPDWWREQRLDVTLPGTDDDTSNDLAVTRFVVADPAVDLVAQLAPARPAVSLGVPLTSTVTVRNRGWKPSAGAVKLVYSSPGAGTTVTAAGEGWKCIAKDRACTSTAVVQPGAALPPVVLTSVTVAGNDIYSEIPAAVRLEATVVAASDQEHGDDRATVELPVDAGAADLFGVFEPQAVGAPGGPARAVLSLTNVGTEPLTAPVTVTLGGFSDRPGVALDTLQASGAGWTCVRAPRSGPLRCTTDADVAGGGAAPALTVDALVSSTLDPQQGDGPSLSARWTSVGDRLPTNNLAAFEAPAAPRRADLLPVLTGPARPVAGGTPSAPTTGAVTASVINAGPDSSSGALRLGWYDGGPEGQPVVAAAGQGWSCSLSARVCTRSTPLAAGAQTPPVTLTVRNTPGSVGNRSAVEVWVGDAQDGAADANVLRLAYAVY